MLPVTEAIVTELSKRYEMNDVEKNAARPEHNKKRVKHKHTSSLGAQSNKIQMPDAAKSSKYHPTAISVPTVASTFDGRLTEQFKSSSRRTTKNKTEALEMSPETRTLRIAFFLSVAYSANIGGTGTITGTGPNLVLQGLMDE